MRDRVLQTWRYVLAPEADRRHAERTAEVLRALGADEELVSAGLLHDVAKPANTHLWHRVAAVLLERFAPRVRIRLSHGEGTFARYLDHARRGAAEARRRGASQRVVRLIERHHAAPLTEDERLLHRADREALP
jgi:putative nucleotidyltransferase with HDIG domain